MLSKLLTRLGVIIAMLKIYRTLLTLPFILETIVPGDYSAWRLWPIAPLQETILLRGASSRFHDSSSTDISSTTLRLQTFRLQTFRLQLYTRVQGSYKSNFCFSKSLFSSIPTSTYTMIPFINPMIIQHI